MLKFYGLYTASVLINVLILALSIPALAYEAMYALDEDLNQRMDEIESECDL